MAGLQWAGLESQVPAAGAPFLPRPRAIPVVEELPTPTNVVVISPVRIYREGLAQVLALQDSVRVVGVAGSAEDADPLLAGHEVDVVLYDLAAGGLTALHALGCHSGVRIVVLGLSEDDEPILACARAGIAGFLTLEEGVLDLTRRIREASGGEFTCSPRLAATLLRGLAATSPMQVDHARARLTPRELEIVGLIERGLSNKEIARELTIQLATVKNHVHNLLEKLCVRSRVEAVRAARSAGTYPQSHGSRTRTL